MHNLISLCTFRFQMSYLAIVKIFSMLRCQTFAVPYFILVQRLFHNLAKTVRI